MFAWEFPEKPILVIALDTFKKRLNQPVRTKKLSDLIERENYKAGAQNIFIL